MTLLARLLAAASDMFGVATQDAPLSGIAEEQLAATALLVHVARADGVLDPKETERLVRLIRTRYATSDSDARDLIERASRFDSETRDMASLVELIGIEVGVEERTRLVSMAWAVAGADGAVHEFEEALVWRLGKLLGLDETAIGAARTTATSEAGTAPA